jgi:hypothetical protein
MSEMLQPSDKAASAPSRPTMKRIGTVAPKGEKKRLVVTRTYLLI